MSGEYLLTKHIEIQPPSSRGNFRLNHPIAKLPGAVTRIGTGSPIGLPSSSGVRFLTC